MMPIHLERGACQLRKRDGSSKDVWSREAPQHSWEERMGREQAQSHREGLGARLGAMWPDPMMRLPGPLVPHLQSGSNANEPQGVMRTPL